MSRFFLHVFIASIMFSTLSGSGKEISDIAYQLARKELNETEWTQYVSGAKKKYETWVNDNGDGNMKRYLDDKIVELAPAALRGNVKALKALVLMAALYNEFQEPPLNRLSELMHSHESDLEELLVDFSWERAAQKIKDRKLKYDDEQKKLALKK